MSGTRYSVSSSHQRVVARVALGVIGAGIVLLLAAPPSHGFGAVLAQPSGSASPSASSSGSPSGSPSSSPSSKPSSSPTGEPEPTGPSVAILNPNPAYDPLVGNHELGSEAIPQISDKLDADETYHVVAHTAKVPADATGVAVWASDGGGETTIGDLERTEDAPNVWGTHWNVPEDLDGDTGKVFVRIYDGTQKIAEHSVEAEIDLHEETVELTWPTNGGQLGFFKSSAGPWRTVIDGIRSTHTRNLYLFFSASARGANPKFTQCATATSAVATTPQPFQMTCTLPANTVPSQVTSIAIVAGETDNPVQPGGGGFVTQESADVHGVRPYLQDPTTMKVAIEGVAPTTPSANHPTGSRRVAGNGCIAFDLLLTDHLDRPVQGANVDVHVTGPDDESGTGVASSAATGSSPRRPPEEGGHTPGDAWNCDSAGNHTSVEGRHENPEGKDTKHIESQAGTGLAPTAIRPGGFRFHVYSPTAGDMKVVGWVDEEPLKKEDGIRKPNLDTKEAGEPSATVRAQFLEKPVTVEFAPPGDSAMVGDCHRWRIRVRGGKSLLDGVNVDVHASGPTTDLDFCDPGGGSNMSAPDLPPSTATTKHAPEEEDEASHPSNDPKAPDIQHSEGTTNEQGDLIIGLTSPLSGDTTVTAWLDGDPEVNDDEQKSGEVSGSATLSWASSAQDAEVRFVNPSGYSGGNKVSSLNDGTNTTYHVVTRVDAPSLIQGVELLISNDGQSFSKVGDLFRVSQSDVWAMNWDTSKIASGTYTLRARIIGTEKVEDRSIAINNTTPTLEINQPADTAQAIFVEGKTTISGTTSQTAAGVDLYYTITAANQVRNAAQWKACGTVTLAAASQPKPFSGECTLVAGDSANEVTGVAAAPFTCDPVAGCSAPLGAKTAQSGDAHRVFGAVANPIISIDVGDGRGDASSCQRIVIEAKDQSGEPIGGQNVDVHLGGPSDNVEFCSLEASNTRSPDQGGHNSESGETDEAFHSDGTRHTEGETGTGGKLIVGIRSSDVGTSDLDAWLDLDDDDTRDDAESTADSAFEWSRPGGCTETGTSGDDVLVGGPGVDRLCGRGGDDVMVGKGGNDIVIGGAGNDVIRGNGGRDTLRGAKGRDTLFGGPGKDSLNGGPGKDRCKGGPGRDRQKKCER